MTMIPERIYVPLPPMGGKIWLLERKGLFVLEEGPGTILTIACTHAGSGQVEVFDGIPDERGFFDDESPEPEQFTAEEWAAIRSGDERDYPSIKRKREAGANYAQRNGRAFYRANPVVMGSWMMNGGFIHGLTIRTVGEHQGVNMFASIVWMPFTKRGR